MNKLDQFIAWLLSWVNRAIYVWGGQGETITSATQIYRMETSNFNALRAIALWIKRGRNAVCFDCSGLLVAKLISMGLLTYDTTANGLLSRCERILKSQLKRGDWVFRVRDGRAHHIGVVVEVIDGIAYVVESMGRDVGVVKRSINASGTGYWNVYGRPTVFKADIEAVTVSPTPTIDKALFAVKLDQDMYVRSGPGTSYSILEVAKDGIVLGIAEVSSDSRWGRIQNQTGKWICITSTYATRL